MPYKDKKKLIESLQSIAQRRISQRMNPVNKEETIFSSGDVDVDLFYTSSDKQVLPELTFKSTRLVLQSDTDIAAVIREIGAL